jgi:transcriptional regulator with XRE-family HTH domain
MTRASNNPAPAVTTLGGRIVAARQRCEMQQQALAEQAGLAVSHLCKIERNRLSAEALKVGTLVRLCRALNVSLDHVVFGTKPKTESAGT